MLPLNQTPAVAAAPRPSTPFWGMSTLRLLLPPLMLLLFAMAMSRGHQMGWWRPGGDDLATLVQRALTTGVFVAGAWLAVRALELLVWEQLVARGVTARVPRLLRQLVALLLVGGVSAYLISGVWGLSVVPVLATTGAIGIFAGLALRNTLADLFAGIALNVEHSFRLGDFVLLHVRGKREPVAGFVREVNWRSTTVLTPEDNLISVPNSEVARATIENLSFPSPVYELELDIVLDWSLAPEVLEPLLGAAMTEAWVRGATSGDRPPKYRICRLDGAGVAYRIVYLIDPRKKPKGPARHTLLSCLHRHLRLAGLRPVHEAEAANGLQPAAQRPWNHALETDREQLLALVPLLAVLTPAERQQLAAQLQVLHFEPGQAVLRAGDGAGPMYIVAAGVLEVFLRPPEHGGPRVNVLAPGDVMGEMSLLTGEARSATVNTLSAAVLYELPYAAMAALLAARPSLADALSVVVSEYQRRALQASQLAASPGAAPAGLAQALAARIRAFFGP